MIVIMYLTAIVAANLSVTYFGPSAAILNAFLFIGLDLTARDILHDRWTKNLWPKMLTLIGAGSALSFAFNANVGLIAIASFIAFFAAGIVDTLTYKILITKPRHIRVNGSNMASAIVDSILFVVIAFGWPPLWPIIGGQILAKIVGGFVWSIVIKKRT